METLRRITAFPLVVLVRGYQLFISPLLPQSCRFYPSCSAYALTAVQRFGPIRGSWLAARRLGRCHPWNPGGVDHVPVRGADGRPVRKNGDGVPDRQSGTADVDEGTTHQHTVDGRHR